jgi:hypothetical protein
VVVRLENQLDAVGILRRHDGLTVLPRRDAARSCPTLRWHRSLIRGVSRCVRTLVSVFGTPPVGMLLIVRP